MPKIIVEIEYDSPDDPYWLNPDNVHLCLQAYCKNTRFNVTWAKDGDPWKDKRLEEERKKLPKISKWEMMNS